MTGDIVQFRFPREDLDYLARRGLNPNEVARERLRGLVRRLRTSEQLGDILRNPVSRRFDPVAAVRAARRDLDRRR